MVDVLTGSSSARSVQAVLAGRNLHAPAHFDSEVLSAFGRLHHAGSLVEQEVSENLDLLAAASVERHALHLLVAGAWKRRENLRLVDALYVELAEKLSAVLVTTDTSLARAYDNAELPAL